MYVKIRFSYAVFLLAGIAAINTFRLRWAQGGLALCFAFFVARNLQASGRALNFMADAANEYLPIASRIPPRATFVRLRYAIPDAPDRFLYKDARRDPLEHLDALVAACHGAIDLSDYEALSHNFPLIYKSAVSQPQQSGLGSLEAPNSGSLETFKWLLGGFPKPVDYVLLIGDPSAPSAVRRGIAPMLEYLDGGWRLVAISAEGWFRLYRRPDAPGPIAGGALCR